MFLPSSLQACHLYPLMRCPQIFFLSLVLLVHQFLNCSHLCFSATFTSVNSFLVNAVLFKICQNHQLLYIVSYSHCIRCVLIKYDNLPAGFNKHLFVYVSDLLLYFTKVYCSGSVCLVSLRLSPFHLCCYH